MGWILKMILFVIGCWVVALLLAKIGSQVLGEEISATEVFAGFFKVLEDIVRWLVS